MIGRPGSPALRSLSLDMERRGFVVYIVVRTSEQMATVQSESRGDIRPLMLEADDVRLI